MKDVLAQPFFQVTLPLMVTFVASMWAANWMQNKRIDEISKRIDDVIKRLDRIEARLDDFANRITALETAKWGGRG